MGSLLRPVVWCAGGSIPSPTVSVELVLVIGLPPLPTCGVEGVVVIRLMWPVVGNVRLVLRDGELKAPQGPDRWVLVALYGDGAH